MTDIVDVLSRFRASALLCADVAAGRRSTVVVMERGVVPPGFALETRQEIFGLKTDVAAVRTEIHERFDSVDTRLDSVDTRLDSVDTRLDSVDTRLDSVDTRLDGMDAQLKSLVSAVTDLGEKLDQRASDPDE